MLRSTVHHYECYVLLRMLRSISGAVRHHYECYEDLRMLRSFFLQMLRFNAPDLQMLRFTSALS